MLSSASDQSVYVATFYTHFDAMTFVQRLRAEGLDAKPIPVPRRISSSCGTAVRFETGGDIEHLAGEGMEKVYRLDGGGYVLALDCR